MMMSSKRTELNRSRDEAIARLRQMLPAGTTVFTILRSVSRSGMKREIDVLCWDSTSKEPVVFSWLAGLALDHRLSKTCKAVVVPGTGMDMEFCLVSNLSHALHGHHHALRHRRL
jgi:hypothetical protein